MNRKVLRLFFLWVLMLALGVSFVSAQDDELPGPGEGGAVIRANTRGSANLGPLTPVQRRGVDCTDPNTQMWPTLIGLDPATLQYAIGAPVSLATGWEVSEDGLTYTVTMRQDAFWNDGTPVTAEDIYFFWEALQQRDVVGIAGGFIPTADALVAAEVIDDYTIAFTFASRNCEALRQLALVSPLPRQAYGYTRGQDYDWASMVNHPMDTNPAVTSGPFQFQRSEPGTAVYLTANLNYWDPINELYTVPEGFVYVDILDFNVLAERFLSFTLGDVNYVHEPDPSIFNTLLASDEAQTFVAPGRVWHYVSLNLADPDNPQPGLDEDGNVIDQGHHPLFGDVRVRQALQAAMNIDEVINGPLGGNGTAMVAGTIPTAYTIHPRLERRAFDLDAARGLLDEAGWVSSGDPLVNGGDGLRTCQGCMYAEEGTEFSFELMNPGGVRNDVSIVLQAQFAQIGVDVEVAQLDFNTLLTNMGVQTYDAAIIGWRGSLPFEADQRGIFGSAADVPSADNAGSNRGSYYSEEFEELGLFIAEGEGCVEEERIAAAQRIQEIFWEEQPYLWLYALNDLYAAAPNVAGFAPYPSQGAWNLDAWNVSLNQ